MGEDDPNPHPIQSTVKTANLPGFHKQDTVCVIV